MHSPATASIIAQLAVADRGATTRTRKPARRNRLARAARRTQVD